MGDVTSLIELDDKWGWATEGADPDRLPDTLRRIDLAARVAMNLGDRNILAIEIALLHEEGAIRG